MKKIFVLVLILVFSYAIPVQATLSNEIMKIVSKYGDDAVKLFSKYGDDAFKAVSKFGDDVVLMVTKFGDDAVKIVAKYGDDGVKILSKYGDDAVKVFRGFGDDAIKAIKKYDDIGLKLFLKNGTVGIEVLARNTSKTAVQVLAELTEKSLHKVGSVIKQAPKAADDMFKLVEKYGQPAVDFVFENGEKALKIISRNKASIAFVAVVTYAFTHPEQVEKGIVLVDNQIRDIVAKPINTIASGAVVVAKETVNNFTDNWLVKLAVAIALLFVVWLLCWMGSDFYKKRMATKQETNSSQQIADDFPKPPSWS